MLGMLARGLVLAAVALPAAAGAQSYPSKPVRMIVPFAAAGPTDVIARVVGQKLAESFGQQFNVENVPGAGGNTGTAQVAKAPADGYTLLVVSTGFVVNPSLYARGAVRSDQGVRAGHAGRGVAERAGGQSERPGQDGRRSWSG